MVRSGHVDDRQSSFLKLLSRCSMKQYKHLDAVSLLIFGKTFTIFAGTAD